MTGTSIAKRDWKSCGQGENVQPARSLDFFEEMIKKGKGFRKQLENPLNHESTLPR
jgi:hypothetical protein